MNKPTSLIFAVVAMSHPVFGESPLPSDAAGRRLQSAMIWSPTVPSGTQAYVAFRKTFELPGPVAPSVLHLFADSRYMLWVNGAYVLRGPCRFNPKRPEYDSVDLRPFMKQGGNTLVVLVHHLERANEVSLGQVFSLVSGLPSAMPVRASPGFPGSLVLTPRSGV